VLLIWRKAVYEGGCSELDIKEQRMVFLVHIVPKLVVETKRVEQVMKLGFLNLDNFAYYDGVTTIYTADMDTSFLVRASESLVIIPWDTSKPMYPAILGICMSGILGFDGIVQYRYIHNSCVLHVEHVRF
jgi:hypothetical protein